MSLLLVFLLGLAIGSFLNVCIYRLPRGESIVHPRSRCPHCQAQIRATDNIPVVSYLLLRGRCRNCHQPIAAFYPLVELASAGLLALLYLRHGLSPLGWKNAVFALLLLVLIVTDLRDRILPDVLTLPGIAAGVVFSLSIPVADESAALLIGLTGWIPHWRILSLAEAAFGAIFGVVSFFVIRKAYWLWRHREGLGLGDIKMIGLVGAFLGMKLTFATILLSSLAGSFFSAPIFLMWLLRSWTDQKVDRVRRKLMFRMRKPMSRIRFAAMKTGRTQIRYGVFLGTTALFLLLWGEDLLAWYVRMSQIH